MFLVPGLVKPHLEVFLPSFPPDASLCITSYLKRYIDIAFNKRNNSSSRNILFISYIKPHKAVKTSSISGWPKNVLRLAGIDTSQFSAHSTRSCWPQTVEFPYQILRKLPTGPGWEHSRNFIKMPILDSYAHRILSFASSVGNPQSHDSENEVDRG